tara:strand:- start:8837 stop:9379 length:543 start_codon:yes stop_codon:yes gene_type:complete
MDTKKKGSVKVVKKGVMGRKKKSQKIKKSKMKGGLADYPSTLSGRQTLKYYTPFTEWLSGSKNVFTPPVNDPVLSTDLKLNTHPQPFPHLKNQHAIYKTHIQPDRLHTTSNNETGIGEIYAVNDHQPKMNSYSPQSNFSLDPGFTGGSGKMKMGDRIKKMEKNLDVIQKKIEELEEKIDG